MEVLNGWISVKIGNATHSINAEVAAEMNLAEFKAAHPQVGDWAKEIHAKAVKAYPKLKTKK
jgi:hypothetical protein